MSHFSRRSTFADRLAFDRKIELSDFDRYVITRCLHAPLRWIYPLLRPWLFHYLESDIQCVKAVGALRSKRELESELAEFSYHPCNREFLRRILKQRLSTHRLSRLVRSLGAKDLSFETSTDAPTEST
jgi:hypothetical protein